MSVDWHAALYWAGFGFFVHQSWWCRRNAARKVRDCELAERRFTEAAIMMGDALAVLEERYPCDDVVARIKEVYRQELGIYRRQ